MIDEVAQLEREAIQGEPRADGTPPLDEAALHGLAGDVVRTLLRYTEAGRAPLLLHFLVMIGNVIGRLLYEASLRRRPILYLAVFGRSSRSAKGTANSAIKEVMFRAFPDWAPRVPSGLISSGEGLVWAVRDASPEYERNRSKDDGAPDYITVTRPGVEDKRLLPIITEFGGLMKLMKKDGSVTREILKQAWDDDGSLSTMSKTQPAFATRPLISLIMHGTPEELREKIDDVGLADGFGNRFLWCLASKSKLLPNPQPVPEEELDPLCARLRDVERATNFLDGPVARDAEAENFWNSVHDELAQPPETFCGSFLDRGRPQVMRLATIYSQLDKAKQIRIEHMKAGMAVWKFNVASVNTLFEHLSGNRDADKLLAELKARFHKGMNKREMFDLFGRNRTAVYIDALVDRLIQNRFAVRRTTTTQGGGERIFATKR
jgi:Protein of unknown function (DUF3987)